ncbi:MAG: hypothetical protein P8J33_13040 [Pirellulaceae bacterium]|nr:hypothetical protein [Pirellulaceae bacterium]
MKWHSTRLVIHALLWGAFLLALTVHLSTIEGQPLPMILLGALVTIWTVVDISLSAFLSSVVNCKTCGLARDRESYMMASSCPECEEQGDEVDPLTRQIAAAESTY